MLSIPILYCGDPHGQFERIVTAAEDRRSSPVVLLGDLEPKRPLHEELAPILDRVWFIHGNHCTDTVEVAERVWEPRVSDRNVHGRVVTLPNGVRLAGLGGIFRTAVWNPNVADEPRYRSRHQHARATPRQDRWNGSVHRTHWSTIYPEEVDRLSRLRADVLITHEAPGYHPHGFEVIDALARAMGVQNVVHGHHHDRLDSSAHFQTQGFLSFGVGLRGITAIDLNGNSEVVLQGEQDYAQKSASRLRPNENQH